MRKPKAKPAPYVYVPAAPADANEVKESYLRGEATWDYPTIQTLDPSWVGTQRVRTENE